MSRLLTDDSEVVFEQSEETELKDTQPHEGTRRKSIEFDQPGEEELEATGGGGKDNVIFHSEEMSDLRPELQIRNEEETRTSPRREPQRMEGQQPGGPRDRIKE